MIPLDLVTKVRSSCNEMSSRNLTNSLWGVRVALAFAGVVGCGTEGEVDGVDDVVSDEQALVVQPPAPPNLVASNIAGNKTNLTWVGVTGADNYVIWRSSGPNASGTETQYTGNAPVPTATSYGDKNEVLGTKYCFKVLVHVPASAMAGYQGNSPLSNEACVTNGAVFPPLNLTATDFSAERTDLSWSSVVGTTNYIIWKSSGAGASHTETQFTGNAPSATGTTFSDQHELMNTQYCFRVKAFVPGKGASGLSNEVCLTKGGTPPGPTGVAVAADTYYPTTRLDVSWPAVANATNYAIYASTGGGAATQIGSVDAPTVSYVATGLTPGTAYTFQITSKVAGVVSNLSTGVTGMTSP